MDFCEHKHTKNLFLGGLLELRQSKHGYRAGMDAVLLASICPARSNENIIDLGAGVGTVGLCVAARLQKNNERLKKLILVEKEEEICLLAKENCIHNQIEADIIHADIYGSIAEKEGAGLKPGQAHHIVMNPPYYSMQTHLAAKNDYKSQAHMVQEAESIESWIKTSCWLLKAKGSLSLIYPVQSLELILSALKGRFGAIKILSLASSQEKAAKRVLIQATRDSAAPLSLLPPLIIHEDNGNYTPKVEAILRQGDILSL